MFNFFSKPQKPISLPYSTDIHCHVIPGVDDGSPDVQTSADLIEHMQKWGISRIFASPHVTKSTFENTPETLAEPLRQLRAELTSRGNDIEVNHHAEYRLDDFSLAQFEAGTFMSLPGNYIMIENPFVDEPWFIDQVIFDLQVKGFTPVLAHPERYSYYFKRRDRYKALHDAGAKFQVNVLSLAEAYGKEQRAMAGYLISNGLVDFLGTDLHNSRHAEIIDAYLSSKHAAADFAALEGHLLNDKI